MGFSRAGYPNHPLIHQFTPSGLRGLAEASVAAFAAHFRTAKRAVKSGEDRLPLLDRLPQYVIEGSKDGLVADLAEAMKTLRPLEIINGPLMKGMDEVGRLFNNNELIVAEVLQSAEVMKAAVSFLEPHMEKTDSAERGRVLLATVKGDVHDIGKNLVEIIFANNGFKVINLGIKVPPEQLIAAVREHNPDIVGLSGLLVKSAQQMVITAEDLTRAGISVPVLVGGAALTRNFVDKAISKAYTGEVIYAKDAMNGLDLAKQIVDPEKFDALKKSQAAARALRSAAPAVEQPISRSSGRRSGAIESLAQVPIPPDLQRHVIRNTPLDHIWNFINPLMLYGRHLGIKGGVVRQLVAGDFKNIPEASKKSIDIWNAVEEVKADVRQAGLLKPSAVYRFFKASSHDNFLTIRAASGEGLCEFDFPRQPEENGLCLSDYVRTQDDHVAFFVVTAAHGVREKAQELKEKGDYLKSHILQALALESAEAYAELLHSKLRGFWGFSDPVETTMMERFQAKYRGKRYSFGYPACPRLNDQELLFNLLKPEDIGVELTDGFMMDPEASVSAIVFHHPQASYFSVGQGGSDKFEGDNR